MNALVPTIQRYLADVLGTAPVQAKPWIGKGLPFFILDSFDLVQLPLFGRPVILAIDNAPGTLSPTEIATRLRKVRMQADLAVYAAPSLSYDDRRRLIEHKVPFVIPGNQLYLPDLGIDLREHFKRRAEKDSVSKMSPSTQAMLFRHLLDRLQDPGSTTPWQIGKTTHALGYAVMTGSRAANEIVGLGLGELERRGRSIRIRFQHKDAQGLWQSAQPFVRSPVMRTRWLPQLPTDLRPDARVCGIASLAKHSLLHDLEHPVLAVRREDWLAIADRDELARPETGATELQIWAYSPALVGSAPDVDPLSLIASLRDDPDERVQLALKAFEESLPW